MPTIHDRALQALAHCVLEPAWEARFAPNSYGCRPGRSCHDAIETICTIIGHKAKYVLDADIEKCFDRIDLSLSRLNHWLPRGKTNSELWWAQQMSHTSSQPPTSYEAASVFDAATALDTAIDMVDPQPTLVQRLVRHGLLPRKLLPQIEINSTL